LKRGLDINKDNTGKIVDLEENACLVLWNIGVNRKHFY